jgi:hypothetical protein
MEHKSESNKGPIITATESKGVLGSVWSAAGAIGESVKHAVQGTIDAAYQTADRIQHDAEAVTTVGEYVAHKVVDSASSVFDKTVHTAETFVPARVKAESKSEDALGKWLSSPTDDIIAASKTTVVEEPTTKTVSETISDAAAKTGEIYESAKKTVSDTLTDVTAKAAGAYESAKQTAADVASMAVDTASKAVESVNATIPEVTQQISEAAKNLQISEEASFKLELTMDVVAHLQRIADRTGDKILHETARKAHSACAKGLSEAPGVHLVRITPEQATELVNLAIMTQDHELADFARYCQSVAATNQIGIEPAPGKIQEELSKGKQELQRQGRVHTGPGYGAAFASISRSASTSQIPSQAQQSAQQSAQQQTQQTLAAATASSALASASSASASASAALTMDMVAHIQRIADRTGDKILHETARKAHSACAKGLSEAPGVHLVSITPDQASELVNLAIRTQDHELANFARYCQSVAATTQIGIEPSPGKIVEEIAKGRQELQQLGRSHTGPGYGAAFASISRANSAPNLARALSSSSVASTSSATVTAPPAKAQIQAQAETQVQAQAQTQEQAPTQPTLQLTMDVVAHLQRIADRTGDELLHETARRAHSACAKNISEAPGVHLTWVTPDQATELVNLAIRTQDHELADFARYCQSVAATTQIAVEPSPGKIKEEIEKGRAELQQQGRAHTGPGYGAAFASKPQIKTEQTQQKIEQQQESPIVASVGQPSQ